MRAKEFTINVPITITINGDEDPIVNAGDRSDQDDDQLQQNPVMVAPLQQEIELAKAELGKKSPVIDKLTADQTVGMEPEQDSTPIEQLINRIKALSSR